MSADPAELIFFHEMTPEKFFQEAERLGVPLGDLQDHVVRNRVFHSCLIAHRAETTKAVAAGLSLPITEDQATAIARNSLVPDVLPEPAPLTPEERTLAVELYFHAIHAAAARHGTAITEKAARAGARKMIRLGERGLTAMQKFSRAAGCLVVLGAAGLAVGFVLLSVAFCARCLL